MNPITLSIYSFVDVHTCQLSLNIQYGVCGSGIYDIGGTSSDCCLSV